MIRVEARRLSSSWAMVWMVALAGCVAEVPPVELGPVGSARVVFVLPRSVPADSVARVTATASRGSFFSSSLVLEGEGTVWQGWLRSLPARQRYAFRIEAFDAAGARQFDVEVDSEPLEQHQPALILLVGGVPGATAPLAPTPPFIEAVVGSKASVVPGGAIQLRAVARGLDAGEELSYTWEADAGTFDDAHSASPTWTAPASGGQRTLTLVVGSGEETLSLTFTLDVTGVGTLSDGTTVRLNRWPKAGRLVAVPAETVAVGQEVTLELQGVADEEGDALTYTWSASCEGSRAEGTGPAFRFTPSALPEAATCDNCIVQVRVEDAYGGAVGYGVGLCVRDRTPPSIVAASPTTLTAAPGELLKLSISAEDPSGGTLSFGWKANTGTLGVPVQTGDTSEVLWTALSCVPSGVMPTIEVTVTNSVGLSIRVRYEVSWSGPACGHPECKARLGQELITLEDDCITDTPVFIPDGLTLDGAGRVLTAVDPVGGTFGGAILRNRGETAHVRNVKVRAQGLLTEGPCAAGSERLAGIRLLGASGSVVESEVSGISRNQRVADNPAGVPWGCQEGFAIEVRNPDASVAREVELLGNSVSGYQKAGLLLAGRMQVHVASNTVTGAGPVGHIAQNGIQLSDGATGQVTGNQLTGHAYTGGSASGSGILVAGGPLFGIAFVQDAILEGNTLTGNDVGLNLYQAEANGGSPVMPTHLRVRNNTLHNGAVTNPAYQAGISDLGTGNLISSNIITGEGYDPNTAPGATFDVDVLAGAASQVVFLTAPEGVAAGACSGSVVVQSQDAQGNLSKPAPEEFNLTASGEAASGLTFHADPECAGPAVSTVALSTAQAEAAFYFKAPQPGTVTLTVSNGALSGSQVRILSSP
ncbi:MAG: right-handed parallel beta-helix repeat-containing protein [Myxococcaceae bacterium]|nr:right-handed parallel beta-helix repeat-containing protein [Myxococcaceae bacterium]